MHQGLPCAARPAQLAQHDAATSSSSRCKVTRVRAPVRAAILRSLQLRQRRFSGNHATTSQAGLLPSQTKPQQQVAGTQRQVAPTSGHSEFVHLNLNLPPPVNSRVKKAAFVKSSACVADCPPDRFPEFALIGRSNVGKSSLINTMAEQEGLARVSREPGACVHVAVAVG